jgi:hypothetical protein
MAKDTELLESKVIFSETFQAESHDIERHYTKACFLHDE